MSEECGIPTYRSNGGLWRRYRFEEVASPLAWESDPQTVLDFYNERRKKLFEVEPNEGHRALARLEENHDVRIVTQNVDDLHERAGSSQVLHLHGELKKARSTVDPELVYELDHWELKLGDKCEKGSQLRPHIVWFGEEVPMIEPASRIVADADVLLIIGTSLAVYPAAGLVHLAGDDVPKFYVDPNAAPVAGVKNLETIRETAGAGVPELVERLMG